MRSEINKVLMDWNPIGVPYPDLETEYVRYIDEIIAVISELERLNDLIDDIEGNRIGYFYTSSEKRNEVSQNLFNIGNLI